MNNRADIVAAIQKASSFQEQVDLVSALDEFDKRQANNIKQSRSIDLADAVINSTMSPVRTFVPHTAATEWLGDEDGATDYYKPIMAEAALWYGRVSPEVKGDFSEFAEQARGIARRTAGVYGTDAPAAASAFIDYVSFLHRREAASGLDQIDQTTAPDGVTYQPTEIPADVFDTFDGPVHPINEEAVAQEGTYNNPLLDEIAQAGAGQGQPEWGGSVALGYLYNMDEFNQREAASGLQQIDQTTGPDGVTYDPTPLPAEVAFPWVIDSLDEEDGQDVRRTASCAACDDSRKTKGGNGYCDKHLNERDEREKRLSTYPMDPDVKKKITGSRKTADMYGNSDAPHAVAQPDVANSPATTPQPQQGGSYTAGFAAGMADAINGDAATYADGSSGVPFSAGYVAGFSAGMKQISSGQPQSVPGSMGGDNGHSATAGWNPLRRKQAPAPSTDSETEPGGWKNDVRLAPPGSKPTPKLTDKEKKERDDLVDQGDPWFGDDPTGKAREVSERNSAHEREIRSTNPNPLNYPLERQLKDRDEALSQGRKDGRPEGYEPGKPGAHHFTEENQKAEFARQDKHRSDNWLLTDEEYDAKFKPKPGSDQWAKKPWDDTDISQPHELREPRKKSKSIWDDDDAEIKPTSSIGDYEKEEEKPDELDYPNGNRNELNYPKGNRKNPGVGSAKDLPPAPSPISYVSSLFTDASARNIKDFRKAYKFASTWNASKPLVKKGSAEFEAGLYAGISDNAAAQASWISAHAMQAAKYPEFSKRIELHSTFSQKVAKVEGIKVSGAYLAATSTDLNTTDKSTSPSPIGETPLNGIGQEPTGADGASPSAPGGPAPYNGAAPYGQPVVNAVLPTEPTATEQLTHPDRTLAFRKRVQAGLEFFNN